nr:hypothetical protein [Tanacetum cinerariifolium]
MEAPPSTVDGHHGATHQTTRIDLCGHVDIFDMVDIDLFTVVALNIMVLKLGYTSKSEHIFYNYLKPLTSLDEGLYALACEEDVRCMGTLVRSFKLIKVYIEHGVTDLDSYLKAPQFRATLEEITDEDGSIAANINEKMILSGVDTQSHILPTIQTQFSDINLSFVSQQATASHVIDDVMRQLSFDETELDGEVGFDDVAEGGCGQFRVSHDESFRVDDMDLNLNEPVSNQEPIMAEVSNEVPIVEEVGTQEFSVEDVVVEDYVSSEEDVEQGNGQQDESAFTDGQFFYDDERITNIFLIDEENEIVKHDVDSYLFGISMDLPFENIGITNLVSDDVLGMDVDVINADGFDSDLGNDEEKNNRKRRLAELSTEIEGVINASGQWKYSFYTRQKITTPKEARDKVYLHFIESRMNLKLYKNDGVRIRARCDRKVPVFTMSQGTGPTGQNREMEVGPSGSSGPTTRSKKGKIQSTNHNTTVKITVERNTDPSLPTRVFQRIYICLRLLKLGIRACRRDRLGLDGAFIKGPFPGQVLVAVRLDSNNGIYPLAYALAKAESKSSWCWFLQCLGDDIDLHPNSNFTFISDRQKGIILAIKTVFSSAKHIYFLRHIHENIKQGWFGQAYKDLLWRAASATNIRDFEKCMMELKTMNPKAHKWLNKIPSKHWARSYFSGYEEKKFGVGGNNTEAGSSASGQAQQTEPAVGQDGSGGSGAGAVIGLSAAGEGGTGVASQGSSRSRWKKRRVQIERISPQKRTPTQSTSQPSTSSQVPVSKTKNAYGREMGDGVPTQSSVAGVIDNRKFMIVDEEDLIFKKNSPMAEEIPEMLRVCVAKKNRRKDENIMKYQSRSYGKRLCKPLLYKHFVMNSIGDCTRKACITRHVALLLPPLLVPSPPLPLASPLTTSPTDIGAPLGYRAAEIRIRALLPSTSRRTDIPEADVPPQKRACLTTLALRFEARESSAAGVTRKPGPTESDLRRYMVKQADKSGAIAAHVRTLEAHVAALIAQTSSLQTQLTTTLGRIEILEDRDPEPQEGPAEAGRTFVYLLAIIKMAPKIRTTRATPATTTTLTTTVTDAQHQALIHRGVAAALAEHDADRSRNGDNSNDSGTGERRMFLEESAKVERYIGGLPDMIHGSVKASKPYQNQQQPFKSNNVTRAYTAGPRDEKHYGGTKPLCPKCNYHHNGPCAPKCTNCKKIGHLARDCKGRPAATNNNNNNNLNNNNNQRARRENARGITCFECGVQGHYKSDCPKLKNGNQENRAGNKNTMARAYAVGTARTNPNSNVVMGTFPLNNRYALILFETGADRSFISTAFS